MCVYMYVCVCVVIFMFKGLKTAALPNFSPSLFQKNSKADLLNAQSFSFIPVARLTLGFSIKQRQSVICRPPARQDTHCLLHGLSGEWLIHTSCKALLNCPRDARFTNTRFTKRTYNGGGVRQRK